MIEEISEKSWQAATRNEETRRFIRDSKIATNYEFTSDEKTGIVRKPLDHDTPHRTPVIEKATFD